MSKIVGLRLNLQTPQILAASMLPLLRDHPELHGLLSQTDKAAFTALIKQIAAGAIALVAEAWKAQRADYVLDFGKKISHYDGNRIIASIISADIPNGLGIVADSDGRIEFVCQLHSASKEAIERLKNDFLTAFSCLATKEILNLCGYETAITQPAIIIANGVRKLKVAVSGEKP